MSWDRQEMHEWRDYERRRAPYIRGLFAVGVLFLLAFVGFPLVAVALS